MNMDACIDLREVMAVVNSRPSVDRLSCLMDLAGCCFYDDAQRLVAAPAAKIYAVGGLPVTALAKHGVTPDMVSELTGQTMGVSASFSYLSLVSGDTTATYEKVVGEHGHTSVAHTSSVSILVAGVSCAVENEFNSQRDLVHLSRVTEARTAIQSRPPVVVPTPDLAASYARILAFIDQEREAIEVSKGDRDRLEALNLMYPAGKATAFMVTGSLRSFQRLLTAEDDWGKEAEYRQALGLIRQPLAVFWPLLFKGNAPEPVMDEAPVSSHEPANKF